MTNVNETIELLKTVSIAEPNVMPIPSPDQMMKAESSLHITFPPSFRAFLELAGSYSLPFWEVYWIGDSSLGYRHIIEANRVEHEDVESPLPEFLVTFHNNGCGDQICFDTRSQDSEGEYPIVFWDHELSPADNLKDLETIAPSFTAWLMDEVQCEIEENN